MKMKIKKLKLTALILIFLSMFCVVRAQVFNNTSPTTVQSSPNGHTPFSDSNHSMFRGIDPDDGGDPFGPGGGNDGGGNKNDLPIKHGLYFTILLTLVYGIKKKIDHQKTKKKYKK